MPGGFFNHEAATTKDTKKFRPQIDTEYTELVATKIAKGHEEVMKSMNSMLEKLKKF